VTVQQSDVIDHVALMLDDTVLLSISDHLSWEPFGPHHEALLKKVRAYVGFVDSGQLVAEFPRAVNREVVLRIFCHYRPSAKAVEFIERLRPQVAAYGIRMEYGPVYGQGYADDAA
jgi:hypothetical protein